MGVTCNDSIIEGSGSGYSDAGGNGTTESEEEINSINFTTHEEVLTTTSTVSEPHFTSTDETHWQESSKDERPPSTGTTPTHTLNKYLTVAAVAIVIATCLISIVAHVLIWWFCQRQGGDICGGVLRNVEWRCFLTFVKGDQRK